MIKNYWNIFVRYFCRVRYKQNKYPVLFLTSGECTKYDKYHDKRTHSIQDASNFVETAGILGEIRQHVFYQRLDE